jgi:acyl-homoserine-lactone acylase
MTVTATCRSLFRRALAARRLVRLAPALALLAFAALPPRDAPPAVAAPAQPVSAVAWDTWGVPHVYGPDMATLMYGLGWAQARSHGFLLLRLYGEARGRSAEYWGADGLASDATLHTFGIPELAPVWYQSQDAEFRQGLDAFAQGINDYADRHPEAIDDRVRVVLPVSGVDVMAHAARVVFEFLSGTSAECGAAVAGGPRPVFAAGSNAWAIGPGHSADGQAMLLMNPHLPWGGLYTWYEAQLEGAGLDAYGAALVGLPVLGMAFNPDLGWAHTVNTIDGCDVYALQPSDDGYLYDGAKRAFDEHLVTLRVRQPDGSLVDRALTVRRSVHGPVLRQGDDRLLAVRMVGIDQAQVPGALRQWWDLAAAHGLTEFETVLRRMQLPMFTVMYADRAGHILHLFGGLVPQRPTGGWDMWQEPVDGTRSALLWSAVHPYDDLPRVMDPATGWLQNSNSPPWNTTIPAPIRAADYPPYMAPQGMLLREQRAVHMLMADGQITLDKLVAYKHDTRSELADRVLDDLIAHSMVLSNDLAHRATLALQGWDRRAQADSRGMALFFFWVYAAEQNGGLEFAEPWDPARPDTTPRGLANPQAAVAALMAVASQLDRAGVPLDVPWGQVARLRVGARDLPGNGGPGDPFGVFRAVYYDQGDDGQLAPVAGDSFVAAVRFGPQGPDARVLLSYGNSSQPGSPHRGDQLELFARQELRQPWMDWADVVAHSEGVDPIRVRPYAALYLPALRRE